MSTPTCGICLENFTHERIPLILLCGHTFCDNCLKELAEQNQDIKCAYCQESSLYTQLKKNFALLSLCADQKQKPPSSSSSSRSTAPAAFSVRASNQHIFMEAATDVAMETVIIAVIDKSGSMAGDCQSPGQGQSQSQEDVVFSRLDLVKHSMKTVIRMLAARGGSLGIITFSDNANVDLEIQKMSTAKGEAAAHLAVENIEADGGTNIWGGLQRAIQSAAQLRSSSSSPLLLNIQIILLTDGEPTIMYLPQRGIATCLLELLDSPQSFTISTFGFGYDLDSILLENICTLGNGIYGYIPDCSMVGTIFINYCSSALSVGCNNVRIRNQEGEDVYMGNIQVGKSKIIAQSSSRIIRPGDRVVILSRQQELGRYTVNDPQEGEVKDAIALSEFEKAIEQATSFSKTNPSRLRKLAKSWKPDEKSPFQLALRLDLESKVQDKGQLLKAVESSMAYDRWGLNHLISYHRALLTQQAVNFKDAALQCFAGKLFSEIQEVGNEIFDKLPVPKASNSNSNSPNISMTSNFNNADGGCFAGWCHVRMADGKSKPVHAISKGDLVAGGGEVECVVRTQVSNRRAEMIELDFGSLCITPWHPIRRPSESPNWDFPARCTLESQIIPLDYYYNFVLRSVHFVQIGEYDVCTLGHGFTEENVRHDYFGSTRVLENLRAMPSYSSGLVVLSSTCYHRDSQTNLVDCIQVQTD